MIIKLNTIFTPLGFLSLAALLFTQLNGCAINPVSGNSNFVLMTETQEISAGKKYHKDILKQYKVYDDPELQVYVNEIGQELAKNSHRAKLAFHFTVLDSPEVNAFALPGGYVYITRGIMVYLNSEAELAGVIGHEIGHVTARHSVRQQSASQVTGLLGSILNVATGQDGSRGLFSQLGFAISQGYGRDHELEADRLGAQYLARVGYAPENMIEVVSVLKNQELFEKERAEKEGRKAQTYHGLFASHPKNDKRLREVVEAAKIFHAGQSREGGHERYLHKIDGLLFGQNTEEGVVRGNNFYHASLDAKLTAPKDWKIENLPDQLLFIASELNAVMQVKLLPRNKAQSAQKFLLDHLDLDSLKDTRELSTKEMLGYSGVTVVGKTPFGKRKVRYSIWLRDKYAWIFAATTKEPVDFELLDPKFSKLVSSLDRLNENERRLAQPLRVRVIRADTDTRYKSLAASSSLGHYAESQLRLFNADYPSGEPTPNSLIKIVN